MVAKRKSAGSGARKTRRPARKRAVTRRGRARAPARRWSADVTRRSDALDLDDKVFKGSATEIAQSLKRSAERSRRRKSTPYRSAMSMLTFYINRGGSNLSASRRRTLEAAKGKLREAFGK